MKKLIYNEVARCQTVGLQKKNTFTHSLSSILPSFSQNASRLLPPKTL